MLDIELYDLASSRGLTGDPATPRGFQQVRPDQDPLVHLGQLLFFSQSLAGGFDVACGTCHLPEFGGTDGLSIGVGAVPEDRSV
ncbi:MAG: cytochrome C peroxidase, partial [Alcanivoracaceae bacterium]|nr:cytochrome C peroxidase [Alcanivoracaceae bacterium]